VIATTPRRVRTAEIAARPVAREVRVTVGTRGVRPRHGPAVVTTV
jgi:hypothetical protein